MTDLGQSVSILLLAVSTLYLTLTMKRLLQILRYQNRMILLLMVRR